MCSILGYVNTKLSYYEIVNLNKSMSQRGPDNSSIKEYRFNDTNLYFAHNRLAIQDLDVKANQPMESERYVIVFNGEIYNHLELRKDLKSNFLTHSDTETLLALFNRFGIKETISKLIGMFAISLFDKKENKIYLIRDRVGIKPIYWTYQDNEFSFSSELKGFSSHLKQVENDKSLIQFMSLGYIPKNNSYYENIYKLEAGRILVFNGDSINISKYWDLPTKILDISYEDALNKTEELIKSSIKYRLLSDVEVGAFLSGGVDSSLVTALMQKISKNNIKTFSIGFEDKKYDESIYAKEVASFLKTDHYEYKFNASDALELINDFDVAYDEPFGDASSLPMMLLSKETKKHVTVALSGDGGDELFTGYERYFLTENYYNKFSKIPQFGRTLLSNIFKYSNIDKLEKIAYPLKNLSHINLYSVLNTSVKPWELDSIFEKDFIYSVYKNKINFLDLEEINMKFNSINDFSRFDFKRYLPDDILTKVDRASMAYSLEARVPLLDHRIVEFAYSLPTKLKLQKGKKSILKEILYTHVPKELIDRPKKGFSVPLQHWFRKELKEVLFDKIERLDERFNKKQIIKIANMHIYQNKNYEYILWNLMRVR